MLKLGDTVYKVLENGDIEEVEVNPCSILIIRDYLESVYFTSYKSALRMSRQVKSNRRGEWM